MSIVSTNISWRQKRSGRWFSFTSGSGQTTAPPNIWVFSPSKRTCGKRRVEWSVKYWFTVGKRSDNSRVVNLQLNLSHSQYCILGLSLLWHQLLWHQPLWHHFVPSVPAWDVRGRFLRWMLCWKMGGKLDKWMCSNTSGKWENAEWTWCKLR